MAHGQALERGLATDQAHQLRLGPVSPLPVLGPPRSLVTIDIFLPVGAPAAASLALLIQVAEEGEARLVYHPWLRDTEGARNAVRGAEALWEAHAQGRFWALCRALYDSPDLLLPAQQAQLLTEARRLGLDADQVAAALSSRRHRAALDAAAAADRPLGVSVAEVLVNGRPLRSPFSELALRDEIVAGRQRAQLLLRQGVAAEDLAERLRGDRAGPRQRPQAPAPARLPPSSAPSRGPRVAPVSLVLFGSFGDYATRSLADAINRVAQRYPGQVRLSVRQLPSGLSSQRLAEIMSHLAVTSPDHFWQFYDRLVREPGRRFTFGQRDLDRLLIELRLPQPPPPAPGGPAYRLLAEDHAAARLLRVDRAPSLLLNGRLLRGPLPLPTLTELVRQELNTGLVRRLVGDRQD